MIPTANLPLLAPVRLLPLIGIPLADLLQPDLRVLVNLGYGSITNGWSPGPADVPTPIGLLPTNIKAADVVTALAKGRWRVSPRHQRSEDPAAVRHVGAVGVPGGVQHSRLHSEREPIAVELLAGFSTFGECRRPGSSTGGIVNTLKARF